MGHFESSQGRPIELDFGAEATRIIGDCVPAICQDEIHARIVVALKAAYERGSERGVKREYNQAHFLEH
mgnify:CR=1 FL=1